MPDESIDLPSDLERYELVDGVLAVTPTALSPHQRSVGALFLLLQQARTPGLHVVLSTRGPQPDLRMVQGDGLEPVILAVEVLTKLSASEDQIRKRNRYATGGVPYFWTFDPAEPTFAAYALSDGVYFETHRATGEQVSTLAAPIAIRICPREITGP
jgi:Uma2 family endonuclease